MHVREDDNDKVASENTHTKTGRSTPLRPVLDCPGEADAARPHHPKHTIHTIHSTPHHTHHTASTSGGSPSFSLPRTRTHLEGKGKSGRLHDSAVCSRPTRVYLMINEVWG